jgi:DNA-binding NarL/FixJ family response regulator
MTKGEPISVLVSDDTLIAREGWKSIIETAEGIQVIGEASSPLETLRLVRQLEPDVLLLDLKYRGDPTAGHTTIREIKKSGSRVKIIAITAYEDLIADARRAGADAALLKTFTREELLSYIRDLAAREEGFPAAPPDKTPLDVLSDRERQVLGLLADGKSTKQIAESLVIAEATARNHVNSILSKLGVNSRIQAVRLAHEFGLDR